MFLATTYQQRGKEKPDEQHGKAERAGAAAGQGGRGHMYKGLSIISLNNLNPYNQTGWGSLNLVPRGTKHGLIQYVSRIRETNR